MDFKKYFEELKRRKVFKSALAYLAVAWVLIQVASAVLPAFNTPPFVLKALIIFLVLGFPINLVFSWIYDITPEGLKRTEEIQPGEALPQIKERRLNSVIITFLFIAILLLIYNQLSPPKPNSDITTKALINKISKSKSIAVMPFKDNSPNADHEWFGSAIVDAINNNLINIKGLRVIARPSIAYLESTHNSPESIAKNLELTHYLEGSVLRVGDKVRINVQLISSDDFSQQWAKIFDQDMDSIYGIIDEVAFSIGRELDFEFNSSAVRIPDAERTSSTEAYDLYQKAKYEMSKVIGKVPHLAGDYLEKAIKLDSSFYAAYVELGYYWSSQFTWDGGMSDDFEEKIKKANDIYEFVIQKAPSYYRPYRYLANNRIWYNQELEAYTLDLKGTELSPIGMGSINTFLPALGDNPQLHYEHALKAMKTSPFEPSSWTGKGLAEYFSGKHEAAINTFVEAMDKFTNGSVQGTAIRVFYALGKYEKVLDASEQYFNQVPGSRPARVLAYLAAAHYKLGNLKEHKLLMEELRQQAAASPIGSPAFHLALVNAQTGDHEAAFQWLNKAIKDKEVEVYWLKAEPPFKPLYDDPRWEIMLDELGFNDIPKEI